MLLKEKRDRTIKRITVPGGNKQRDSISKEDASSPTAATELVLLTCIIDSEEHINVAVVDILNAFVQTHVQHKKDMSIINIIGVIVDILLENFPYIYEPYVTTYCKGVKQLVVKFQNVIYGTMMASLM